MEEWDILTAEGDKTGERVARSRDALAPGQYHLAVHIWVVDKQRRVLIQQRSDSLHILPGKWAITGGSAVAGEDAHQAAIRELFEEIGVTATADELIHFKTYRGRNDIVNVFILHRTIALSAIKMQDSEVQAVKWASLSELKKMVEDRRFHSYNYLSELYEYIECCE